MEQPEITPALADTLQILGHEDIYDHYLFIVTLKSRKKNFMVKMLLREFSPEQIQHFKQWFETFMYYDAMDSEEDVSFEAHFNIY